MKAQETQFNHIVEAVYDLPLQERVELKTLLEHNIADAKRDELFKNYKTSQKELKENRLRFSSQMADLKKML